MFKLNNQKGDTIIEVLIALALLSLAFVVSYSTANRALIDSQNAQEHSLALEYLDSQLEALRYVASQPNQTIVSPGAFNGTAVVPFCLQATPTGIVSSPTFSYFDINSNPSQYPTNLPAQCQITGSGFNYNIAIEPSLSINDDFHVVIWWQGLGNLTGNSIWQKEELSYRVYDD